MLRDKVVSSCRVRKSSVKYVPVARDIENPREKKELKYHHQSLPTHPK